MKPENAKKIKCDRCQAVIGLHRHSKGWRCPSCIWNERENLIEWARRLLNATDYCHNNRPLVAVARMDMDELAKVVNEVMS